MALVLDRLGLVSSTDWNKNGTRTKNKNCTRTKNKNGNGTKEPRTVLSPQDIYRESAFVLV